MLLRASGEFSGETLTLNAINGEAPDACGVPHAALLIRYAEAFVQRELAALRGLRGEIEQGLGAGAVVDCAGVVSVFDAVVRIADATGIPLESYKTALSSDLRRDLGIDDY